MRNSRVVCCLSGLFSFFSLSAQTVSGGVFDSESGAPLPGAIVRMVSGSGQTLAYRMTDRDGAFSLEAPSGADSLKIGLLGYSTVAFGRPFQNSYKVSLQFTAEQIHESVVAALKVVAVGDTLRYNVNALKRPEDRVLSDMLTRIPGVEVDGQGFVKYNGQPINRFYVEGKDVLEGSYNLATRNLSVDAVKEVEVLDKHQPYKLLQGVVSSDKAAINIVLNDAARGKLIGTLAAGGGVQANKPYGSGSARLSAFFMGKTVSSVNVAGYDGQGNALREPDYATSQEQSYYHMPLNQNIGTAFAGAPLSEKRSLFNHTFELSSIDRITPDAATTFGVSLKLGQDTRSSALDQISRYQMEEGDLILARSESREVRRRQATGLLTFTRNSRKAYISDKIYAWVTDGTGHSRVSGDLSRLSETGTRQWNVENDAAVSFVFGRSVYSLNSFTQFTGGREKLSLEGDNIGQSIDNRLFKQLLSVSGLSRSLGRWRLSLHPSVEWTSFRQACSLAGLSEDTVPGKRQDQQKTSRLQALVQGGVVYKNFPVELSLDGGFHYDYYTVGGLSKGRLLGDVSFLFRYSSGRWDASMKGRYGWDGPDIQSFGDALLLTDYYSLRKGRQSLDFVPLVSLGGEVKYREPISGWNLRLSSTGYWSRSFLSNREIYDGYVLAFLSEETAPVRSLNATAELSKGFFSLNGNLSFTLNYRLTATDFVQNGLRSPYLMSVWTPRLKFTLPLFPWWGIMVDVQANLQSYNSAGQRQSSIFDITTSLKQTFHLSKTLLVGVTTDIYHHGSIGKTLFFPDLHLSWNVSSAWRFRVQADNLLNIKDYNYNSLSPLLEESYSYRIRPLALLVGVDWKF